MEALSKYWTEILASSIELFAAVVIALAALEAWGRAMWIFAHGKPPLGARQSIRLSLGRWLALALEFEVAADILRTAVAPSWSDIGKLAAIIVLRTLLNFFLEREVARVLANSAAGDEAARLTG